MDEVTVVFSYQPSDDGLILVRINDEEAYIGNHDDLDEVMMTIFERIGAEEWIPSRDD